MQSVKAELPLCSPAPSASPAQKAGKVTEPQNNLIVMTQSFS